MNNYIFALGFFDGVHLGHQALLNECTALAARQGCSAAAITFDRHPQALFCDDPPALLGTLSDRKTLLRRFGIQYIHSFPVDRQTMTTPWEAFLRILEEEGAAGFVCGSDFRFGHRGQGNARVLAEYCRQRGLPCVIVPEQLLEDTRISSTHIRSRIEAGDMAGAVRFLGHPHILTGEVVPGKQLGRRLGIPTANLHLPRELAVPKFGVYACSCLVDGKRYPAVTNVGVRPTVSGSGITVESWILDYTGDLYGREIQLEFHDFLRAEEKFNSLEELKAAIHQDAEAAKQFFTRLK